MLYEIKTERLLLRPLDSSDLKTAHEYSSDVDNTKYMMWLPNQTVEETAAFLKRVTSEWKKEKPSFYEFAITVNNQHIGAISVYLDEKKEVGELGWILNKNYHKKGYAYEAALAIKDFALHTLRLKKIIAQCDYRNEPSHKLMEKIGLRPESDNGIRVYAKRNETARELTYSLTFSAIKENVE